MKFLAVLAALTACVVAATDEKKVDVKESKRTGRQFGWQTPYYSNPYNHPKVYGQKYQDFRQPVVFNNHVAGSLAKQNTKLEKHLGVILEVPAVSNNKLPSIELKLKPSKVNATLVVTRSHGKSKPLSVTAPAYVPQSQYRPQSFYGLPNYYQQKPTQNYYGHKELLPVQISAPMIPANIGSDSLYETYNPNYLGTNYNTGYGQYIMPSGQPSFGVQGQYTPSGGILGNYNYFSNYPMGMANNPVNDFENEFENSIPEGIQFHCPVDYSGNRHVVGQATIYPDPSRCDRFYYCQMGHAYVFQCSEDLHYNPDIKACDDRQYFSCGNRAI